MSDDAMAICAPHDAFGNFFLFLSNAFRKADIDFFVVANVIEVQRTRIGKATINASGGVLEVAKPLTNCCSPLVALFVDSRSVFGVSKPSQAPFFAFLSIVLTNARLFVIGCDFLRIAFAPTLTRSAVGLFLFIGIFIHFWSLS